jgi:hypothetical protein
MPQNERDTEQRAATPSPQREEEERVTADDEEDFDDDEDLDDADELDEDEEVEEE